MIHLTHTGFFSGTPFCSSKSTHNEADTYIHLNIQAINNPEYRAKFCPECLKIYAEYGFEETDQNIPDWIEMARWELKNEIPR